MFDSRNIQILLIILLAISVLNACNTRRGIDQDTVKEEMASRELKRVSEGEIMVKGEEIGSEVLEKTQATFQKALMTAIQEKGIVAAVEYCNLSAYKLVQELEDSLDLEIRRVTDKPRNPKDTLSSFERELFEAYQYSPENATAQLQVLDENTLIYNKPIMISTGVCLNCHGTVGGTLTEETYKTIKSLYPNDQAIGYELGDLRGMWSIKIPRKTVIDQL